MGDPQPGIADSLDEALLLSVLSDVKNGDFTVRMPLGWTGVAGKIADRLNDVIVANETLRAELARVSRVVGKEGQISQRAAFRGEDRLWSEVIAARLAGETTEASVTLPWRGLNDLPWL